MLLTNFVDRLDPHLAETGRLLEAANLTVHPAVERVTLHGSRGPARRPRPDSDVDLCLLVDTRGCAPGTVAPLLSEVLDVTRAHWRGAVALDLAVVCDLRGCQLACFDHTHFLPDLCRQGGRDCFGLYKDRPGARGFVVDAGVEVARMYPCLVIWRRPASPPP